MRRRDFIVCVGAVFAWPVGASAQQADLVRRIGVLLPYGDSDPEAESHLSAITEELKRLGWSRDRNIRIDVRFAAGIPDRYPSLAKELVALQPNVMLSESTPAAAALKQETRSIPIVFVGVSDPVGSGFVTSLARPDGDLTGMMQYESGITGKWLAMLKEVAPALAHVAFVANSKFRGYEYFWRSAEAAARALAIELIPKQITNNAADIENAIELFAQMPKGGLLFVPDATIIAHRDLVIALAARYRLPAVYPWRYSSQQAHSCLTESTTSTCSRRRPPMSIEFLRGAKPADLPVQAPTKFETAVNLRAAKALGLTIPPTLLATADEVVE